MNNSSAKVSGIDAVTLIGAVMMGLTFFFLPWATVEGASLSGGDLLVQFHPFETTGIAAWVWLIIATSIVGSVFALWGMFDAAARGITAIVVGVLGALSLVYYGVYVVNGDERVTALELGFLLALIGAVWLVVQAFVRRTDSVPLAEVNLERYLNASFIMVVFGLLVSGYLSYVKLTSVTMLCIEGGLFNCDFVQSSAYSELGGIPIAILGFITYLVIGALLLTSRMIESFRYYGLLLAFGTTLFAWMFSMYLVYLQGEVLRAWCQWCLTHELIITVLFVLLTVHVYGMMTTPAYENDEVHESKAEEATLAHASSD